ncbi:MAG: right-handed parallel beta-helix repeat-containing protein [Streptosporangiaceae bacterium]
MRPARSRYLRTAGLLLAICPALILPLGCGSSAEHPVVPAAAMPDVPSVSAICGRSVLNSPFSYHGAAGGYRSGKAGLPTFGKRGSDFPNDTRGVVQAAGARSYASYQLKPNTVYYLLPGVHKGGFQADTNDAFVGGFYRGRGTVLTGDYSSGGQAIDSNTTNGNQPGVTIEYLTIEEFTPDTNAAAINQEANTRWLIQFNTIELNVPGAGVIAGAGSTIRRNCLSRNGQYGLQSTDVNGFGRDALTTGPYNVTIEGNEISRNDTCDYSGLLSNKAIGWSNRDPVPPQFHNPHCGKVTPDGDEGGFKLWMTDGVTVKNNYIHNNWGPGAWADTDNANTTFSHNVIENNEGQAIIEEVSYNFSITGNYISGNGWPDGLGNAGFPTPAIYISESGSDTTFGSVPKCPEKSCSDQRAYPRRSVISGNTLVNNGGSIFLWQNSNRYCSDGYDDGCTLVDGGRHGPFTIKACAANLPMAKISTVTFTGTKTGPPARDWWDGCLWRTENVAVTHNTIDFKPAAITHCTENAWPDCGAGGIFSEYSITVPFKTPGPWVIPTQLTFFQNDTWSDNTYRGPSTFYAWNQGNQPVGWAQWSGPLTRGDKCRSAQERASGLCRGPFGEDAGSTYYRAPPG